MKIGFIGTGNIGTPMAANILKAGFSLIVHDVDRDKTAGLLRKGARWAGSPKDVAVQCDIICTCLPGPVEMESVALGAGGILEGLREGAIYIDHTTNSPFIVRKVADAVATRKAKMLDAPISGGVEGAFVRDLLVMVGGDEPTFQKATPVLDAIGQRVYRTGDIGTGSICKVLHNTALFCAELAMAECWTLAVKSGVAPQAIFDVFRQGALGKMSNLTNRLPNTYFRGDFEPRFSLNNALKDIGLASELAHAYDVPMSLAQLAENEYQEAVSRGWGQRDSSIVLTLQDERAGVEVRLL